MSIEKIQNACKYIKEDAYRHQSFPLASAEIQVLCRCKCV